MTIPKRTRDRKPYQKPNLERRQLIATCVFVAVFVIIVAILCGIVLANLRILLAATAP